VVLEPLERTYLTCLYSPALSSLALV